jgi:hypothetical protein
LRLLERKSQAVAMLNFVRALASLVPESGARRVHALAMLASAVGVKMLRYRPSAL